MIAIFRGQLDEGERLAQRALELGRQAEGQNLIAAFGGQLLVIRWQQGRVEELRPLIEASRTSQPGVEALDRGPRVYRIEAGNQAAARAEFELLAADRFAPSPTRTRGWSCSCWQASCAQRSATDLRAEQLYELLLPYDGRNIVVSEGVACVGAAAHYLGLLAATARRFDDAEAHLRQAIELNRADGRPAVARPLAVRAGRVLLARRRAGDRARRRICCAGHSVSPGIRECAVCRSRSSISYARTSGCPLIGPMDLPHESARYWCWSRRGGARMRSPSSSC